MGTYKTIFFFFYMIHFYIMANKHIYCITLKKCSSFSGMCSWLHTRVLYATSSTWHLHSSEVGTKSGFGPSHFNPTSLSTGSSRRGGWAGHNVFEMLVSVLKACWEVTRLDTHTWRHTFCGEPCPAKQTWFLWKKKIYIKIKLLLRKVFVLDSNKIK